MRLGDVLTEVDVRARDEEGAELFQVLSLTKNHGLIPQAERFSHRVARADVRDYKVVRPGWLVYNPYVIWEGAIHVRRQDEPGLVSPVYVTWLVGPEADPTFIDYLVRSPQVLASISRLSSGVVQRRRSIKKTAFRDILVPLPSREIQEAIAATLRRIDFASDAAEGVVAACQVLKRAAVERLCSRGFDRDASEGVRETNLGSLPSSWEVAALGDVSELVQYGTSERCTEDGAGPVVLRIPNVLSGRIDDSQLKRLPADSPKDDKLRLRAGDVLFVRTNAKREYTGRCGMYRGEPEDALFASYLIRVRTDWTRLLPEFLELYSMTQLGRSFLSGRASRAADGKFNINSQTLRTTKVPLPPIETQEAIVRVVAAVERKEAAERDRHRALQLLAQSAGARLLSPRKRGAARG